MRMKKYKNTAFSLLEILLAAVIFILSVAGIFVTLNAVRNPVINKENALTSANFGKEILEALRSQVDARTYYAACQTNNDGKCGDFSLYLGPHEVAVGGTYWPAGLSWPSTAIAKMNTCPAIPGPNGGCLVYTVSCGDGVAYTGGPFPAAFACSSPDIARRVDLGINWPSLP